MDRSVKKQLESGSSRYEEYPSDLGDDVARSLWDLTVLSMREIWDIKIDVELEAHVD